MSGAAHALAVIAGALAGLAAVALLDVATPLVGAGRAVALRGAGAVRATVMPLRLAASHGHDPSAPERRRLRVAGVIAGALTGWAAGGVMLGAAAAIAGALLGPRIAVWRRARYARRVEAGAPQAAQAIAGALAGGGSIRGSIAAASSELEGPIAVELRRTAVELEAGAHLDTALDALVARAPSTAVTLIAAAIQLQRRSGGDLAALLRELAASLEAERRAADEAQAATAQARITSAMVLALPPAGVVLAELASPGLVGRMLGSPVGMALVAVALCLQLLGAALVRRLARVGG